MKKYLTVFGLSFENEFVYRFNFIIWRIRNVLRILMTFFLWNSVFSTNNVAFGYNKEQIIAYVFLVLLVSTFVTASPSNENIGSEIANGDLSNYLVKPISYLGYWLTRDWSSKLLNMLFAIGEITALYLIFKPHLEIPTLAALLLGVLVVIFSTILHFFITKIFVLVSFWTPENTWGLMFVFLVFLEVLSGGIFPLDVLPKNIYSLIMLTPFPYLTYFPVGVLIGKFSSPDIIKFSLIGIVWIAISYIATTIIWKRGIKSYSSYGK